ncbi:hypothetical protein [Shewanella algae]|uniref:hypothetical protein n=1 Tax=Shewanella algae TaxID=38313 RepID=UPI0031F4AEAD
MRLERIIKHYNACHCQACSFQPQANHITEAKIISHFAGNWLAVPVGVCIMVLLGFQPLPIKMSCPVCGNTFFASGFRH